MSTAAAKSASARKRNDPRHIGRFEIVEVLGRGSMGTVYRAIDPLIERTVAIKTIAFDETISEEAHPDDHFLREAKSAGRLSHPNIVTIYDVGQADGLAYIAMEFLQGETLKEILDHHVWLPLPLALDTAIQMADALAFANEHGVVHRDVKPANVIVQRERGGIIKLTDFGIAHITTSTETQAGLLMGSPRYMAPEQITGGQIDGRTDVYSAGIVLYEMLTGQPPFTSPDLHRLLYRIVNEAPQPASYMRPGLPREIDLLLSRCLSKQPHSRPGNARELGNELRKLAASKAESEHVQIKNQTPKRLAAIAFSIPVLVFLILSIGMIVIEHFLPMNLIDIANYSEREIDPNTENASEKNASSQSEFTEDSENRSAFIPDYYLQNLDKSLAELRVKKTEMLSTYTELHPDVIMIDRKIHELENERALHLKKTKRKSQ